MVLDKVAQVAVMPVADEMRDEEVMACVVPMAGTVPTPEFAREIQDWCLEKIAYYKAPGWLYFLDALPVTGTQKVQKQEIFPKDTDPRAADGVHDLRGTKKRRR